MAVKDIISYYNECEAQYREFQSEMEDFKLLSSQNMIAPEIIENAQKMLSVVEDNYKKLSYVIFLLNKPVKKEKIGRYSKQNKKLLKEAITKENVISQNKNSIEGIKSIVENIK